MLEMPLWKRLLILVVVGFGLLYAMPNAFYAKVEAHNDAAKEIAATGVTTPEAEAALVKRHETEIAALRAETTAKAKQAVVPFEAEGGKASADFHAVIHKLAPEMCRDHLPMINLNQYPFSGVVTILERC